MGAALSVCWGSSDAEPSLAPVKTETSKTDELIHRIFGAKASLLLPAFKDLSQEAAVQSLASNVDAAYEYVLRQAKRGDVKSVLEAMDAFGYEHAPMLGLGDVKGAFVDAQVEQLKPKVAIELGTSSGYGALRLARKMQQTVGAEARVFSLESWGPFADKAKQLVEFAGLSNVITIVKGDLADKLEELKALGVTGADIVLINHNRELYFNDLRLLESNALLHKGSVVLADGVVSKECNDYRTYVRASHVFETKLEDSVVAYTKDLPDGIEVSTFVGPLSPQSQAKSDELVFHIFGDKNMNLEFGHTTETCCNDLTLNVPANYEYVTTHATRGDVSSVIQAMDEFGYSHFPMISIGDVKGAFVDAQIEKLKPKIVIELGTFTGYGSMRFARKMREVVGPSAHVYTFEVWEPFADYAAKVHEFAGVADMITIIRGAFADAVGQLKQYGVDHTDILLIDHNKELYLSDLHVAEDNGLLKKGTVVLADNVVIHRRVQYCDYVRASPLYETYMEQSVLEYKNDAPDGIEVSTYIGA